jgi:hypothetical protein
MNDEVLNGGQLAILSGRNFEMEVDVFMSELGFDFTPQARIDSFISKYCRVDFLIKEHPVLGRVLIECRNGDSPGSHVQKFPYIVLNSLKQTFDHYVLIADGDFVKNCSQLKWVKKYAKNPRKTLAEAGLSFTDKHPKGKWHVFDLEGFKEWMNNIPEEDVINRGIRDMFDDYSKTPNILYHFNFMGKNYENKTFINNWIEFLTDLTKFGITIDDIRECIAECHANKDNKFSDSHEDMSYKISDEFYISKKVGIRMMMGYMDRIGRKLNFSITPIKQEYKVK